MAERTSTHSTGLSFSIDNILREDFPGPSRVTRSLSSTAQSRNTAPFPRASHVVPCQECFSAHYRPVYLYSPSSSTALSADSTAMLSRGSAKLYSNQVARSRYEISEKQEKNTKSAAHCLEINSKEVETKLEKDDKQNMDDARKDQQKKKRFRSHFSQLQLQYLENIFARQHYLSRDERTLLANALDMTELQVRNWFQNKRYQKRHREIQALQKIGKQVPVKVLVNEGSPVLPALHGASELRY